MLVQNSPLFEAFRGRFADSVLYPVSGRQIARQFVVPANPQSSFQNDVRSIFSSASVGYSNLNSSEKQSWIDAAAGISLIDEFGQPYQITPKGLYIRVNAYRLLDGQALLDTAPAIGSPTPYTDVSVAMDGSDVEINVTGGSASDLVVVYFSAPLPGQTRVARLNDLRLPMEDSADSIVTGSAGGFLSLAVANLRLNLSVGARVGCRLLPLTSNYIPGSPLFVPDLTITAA